MLPDDGNDLNHYIPYKTLVRFAVILAHSFTDLCTFTKTSFVHLHLFLFGVQITFNMQTDFGKFTSV